ncbi:MAG: hypothetical protein HY302_02850 [Opitutae bacterium]|nr:hypothetical protein [Opitutae bacterium]
MKNTSWFRVTALASSLAFLAPLSAQLSKEMQDGLTLRTAAAAAVINGSERSADAITRLKAHASPSGLKIDRDADFAFAALDVGQRLLAAGKAADAEEFFRAAEKSLDKVLKKTPDSAANDKVQFLSALAMIRARYLNNAPQAKADLDAAIKLKPEDKQLESLRGTLGKEHGDTFTERPAKDGKPANG